MEVHPKGAQDGIESITLNPTQAVAVHSMLSFQMSDLRLDRRSPFRQPPKPFGGSPSVAFVNPTVAKILLMLC